MPAADRPAPPWIVDELQIDVFAFGILSDFRTELFPSPRPVRSEKGQSRQDQCGHDHEDQGELPSHTPAPTPLRVCVAPACGAKAPGLWADGVNSSLAGGTNDISDQLPR